MMISAILTQLSATKCYPLDLLSQLVESPVTLSQPRMHPQMKQKGQWTARSCVPFWIFLELYWNGTNLNDVAKSRSMATNSRARATISRTNPYHFPVKPLPFPEQGFSKTDWRSTAATSTPFSVVPIWGSGKRQVECFPNWTALELLRWNSNVPYFKTEHHQILVLNPADFEEPWPPNVLGQTRNQNIHALLACSTCCKTKPKAQEREHK